MIIWWWWLRCVLHSDLGAEVRAISWLFEYKTVRVINRITIFCIMYSHGIFKATAMTMTMKTSRQTTMDPRNGKSEKAKSRQFFRLFLLHVMRVILWIHNEIIQADTVWMRVICGVCVCVRWAGKNFDDDAITVVCYGMWWLLAGKINKLK